MEKSGNFYIEEAESDFKRVHKGLILNNNIDCLTLGIYVKILVLGKKWQLNIKGLSVHLGISDMKIRKSIALLEKEGYISRKAVQDEKTGKLAGWNYTLHAIPLEESKRTCAGRKNNEETVYPENRQHGYPTTRLSDNTETGEDNNNKLKEDIDLKEISKPNQYKEERDKSLSKKEQVKELVDLWNNETRDFPKVRRLSPDIVNSIDRILRRGYSYEDIKKAIFLCNSLSDFYKGKERGKTWKATFQWLVHNTNDNFDKIMNGALHTSQEQQRIYQSVMDNGIDAHSKMYNPHTEGYHLFLNESDGKYYFTGNIINLADGYTKDNRPDGAQVHQNGYTYTWDSVSKEWKTR